MPESNADQEEVPFDQSSSKGFQKKHKYLFGTIALLAFVILAASIIVSMQGKTHQTADRARVEVQEATIAGPLIQHNVPTATILLKNTGHVSALAIKIRLVMTVWTSNKLPDWDMPLKLTSDTETIHEIGPGLVVSQTVSLIAPLTDVQGMHLERKDWFIVILGVLSYIDIFNNPHETKLCLNWRDTSTQHLSRCEKWNEED